MRELDPIQPLDYDDMVKAGDILKRVRKFKNQINEAESKLHDLEEVQSDIIKKMTE
jgi:methionine aminopeptidase